VRTVDETDLQRRLEVLTTAIERDRSINFDKLEIFALNFILKVTPTMERQLWNAKCAQRRSAGKPPASGPTLLPLKTREDLDDQQLLQATDRSQLDQELLTLRQAVRREFSRRQFLTDIAAKLSAVNQELALFLDCNAESFPALDAAQLQRSFAQFRSLISRLVDLEQETRLLLRGTRIDIPLTTASPAAQQTPRSVASGPAPRSSGASDPFAATNTELSKELETASRLFPSAQPQDKTTTSPENLFQDNPFHPSDRMVTPSGHPRLLRLQRRFQEHATMGELRDIERWLGALQI
jgi:hypothetical protein